MKWIVTVVVVVGVAVVVALFALRLRPQERAATPPPRFASQSGGAPAVAGQGSVEPVTVAVRPPEPVAAVQKPATVAMPAAPPPSGPIAHFSDTRIPFAQRLAELQALGKQGDAASIETLMLLGNAPIYANRYAVAALGQCRGAEVRAYLSGKLNDPDALLAIAAIQALGQSAAGTAIPALAQALIDNRDRPDGFQDMVRTAAVKALGLTASAQAAPALIGELQLVGNPNWNLEYGSAVIAALRNMDSAAGIRSIAVYADVLTARMPAERMSRAYYERKIAEARGTPVAAP